MSRWLNLTLFKSVWAGVGLAWGIAILITAAVAFGADIIKPAEAGGNGSGLIQNSADPAAAADADQPNPLGVGLARLQRQPLAPIGGGGGALLITLFAIGFFSYARGQQGIRGTLATRESRTYLITLAADEEVSVEQMATAWQNLHAALNSPVTASWLGRGNHIVVSYIGRAGRGFQVGFYVTFVGGGEGGEQYALSRLLSLNATMQAKLVPNPRPGGTVQYTELRLARPSYQAIATAFAASPLPTLLRLVEPGEGIEAMGVDFLLRPAEGKVWAAEGHKQREKHKEVEAKKRDRRAIEELTSKLDDDRYGFDCRIRIYGTGDAGVIKARIQTIARDYFGAFRAANWFMPSAIKEGILSLGYPVGFEDRSVLSPRELAAVAHIPAPASYPGLARGVARHIAPDPRIVGEHIELRGGVPEYQFTPQPPPAGRYDWKKRVAIGWVERQGGGGELVSISREDLKRHGWGVGPTGVGKSWWIAFNALRHIYDGGSSVVVIEPHGELCYDIAARLAPSQWRRVVVIDPPVMHGYGRIMTFNPMKLDRPDMINDVLDKNVSIFKAIAGQNWDQAPQMQQLIKMAIATLLAAGQGASLTTMYRFISDESYQQELAAKCRNPILRKYWGEIYPAIPTAERAKMAKPVMTRLNNMLVNEYAGDMLGAAVSTFDAAQLINHDYIILATLAGAGRGGEGSEAANTFARLIFMEVFAAAMKRVRDYPELLDRPATWLFADEAQAVLGGAAEVAQRIISEARKANLASFYFNQVPSQLDDNTLDILTGQAGINIVWTAQTDKIGAQLAAQSLGKQVSAYDILNLPRYATYVRAEVGGEKKVFSMNALPLPKPARWGYPQADWDGGVAWAIQQVTAHDVTLQNPQWGGIDEAAVAQAAEMVHAWTQAKRRTVRATSDREAQGASTEAERLYDEAMALLTAMDAKTFAATERLVKERDARMAEWIERNPGSCRDQVDAIYQMSMLRHCVPYLLVRANNERPTTAGRQAGKASSGDDQLELATKRTVRQATNMTRSH